MSKRTITETLNDIEQVRRNPDRDYWISPLAYEAADHLVPLHDAWLQAAPPCPTCAGIRAIDPDYADDHCPDDCASGVVPFDKWTAGLVALWTAVFTDPMGKKPEGHVLCEPCALCVLEYLRSVGGAR